MSYPHTALLIDGVWQDAADGETLGVSNPVTGAEIGRVAHARLHDLERAVVAACKGFEIWRKMTAFERGRIMRKAAELLRARAPEIAPILTREQGKPLQEAQMEAVMAADITEWFADECMRIYGRVVPSRVNLSIRQIVVRDPVGPVAAFTPWNFPMTQVVRKVAAALAAGCSIIVKAAEETPASSAALLKAFEDAGVPSGVLALVYGTPSEVSKYLIEHPAIRKVTFTGSTNIGKQLAALAGQHMKRVTMELGGHAPAIVCDDADLSLAVKTLSAAKFRNAGQVCISPTRFLVHKRLVADFAAALAEHAKSLKVGDGLDPTTQMGPLANPRRVSAMTEFVDDAVSKGAKLLAGGEKLGEAGNFWKPTVLTEVAAESKVFNDEPFGPLAAIRGFETLDDAIREANRLSYGLAGYAFTSSLKNADLLTRHVEVGMLYVNMPAMPFPELTFGGLKDSGYGSEGGPEALDAYLNVRSIAVMNA